MLSRKFFPCSKCKCYILERKMSTPRRYTPDSYMENIFDIADGLAEVMIICGIHTAKARAAVDVITYAFFHCDEVRHRADPMPRKHICKEDVIHDFGRKCLMNRMEAQLAYSITKRAFKAFYQGAGECGISYVHLRAQAKQSRSCLWDHAAKRTVQIFSAYEDAMIASQSNYEAKIKRVYKRLYDNMKRRMVAEAAEERKYNNNLLATGYRQEQPVRYNTAAAGNSLALDAFNMEPHCSRYTVQSAAEAAAALIPQPIESDLVNFDVATTSHVRRQRSVASCNETEHSSAIRQQASIATTVPDVNIVTAMSNNTAADNAENCVNMMASLPQVTYFGEEQDQQQLSIVSESILDNFLVAHTELGKYVMGNGGNGNDGVCNALSDIFPTGPFKHSLIDNSDINVAEKVELKKESDSIMFDGKPIAPNDDDSLKIVEYKAAEIVQSRSLASRSLASQSLIVNNDVNYTELEYDADDEMAWVHAHARAQAQAQLQRSHIITTGPQSAPSLMTDIHVIRSIAGSNPLKFKNNKPRAAIATAAATPAPAPTSMGSAPMPLPWTSITIDEHNSDMSIPLDSSPPLNRNSANDDTVSTPAAAAASKDKDLLDLIAKLDL